MKNATKMNICVLYDHFVETILVGAEHCGRLVPDGFHQAMMEAQLLK